MIKTIRRGLYDGTKRILRKKSATAAGSHQRGEKVNWWIEKPAKAEWTTNAPKGKKGGVGGREEALKKKGDSKLHPR